MTKRALKKRHLMAVTAVAVAAVLLVAACGPGPEGPQEERTEMSIGLMIGLTGPVAAASEPTFLTMSDYWDYMNDEELVPDVNLKLWWIDTGTDEPRQLSAYERFRARGTPLIITIVDTEIFRARSERDQIPFLSMAQTEAIMYPPTWIYSVYPTWAESFSVWCEWVRDSWQGEGKPKVTVMGPDTVAGPPALEPAREYIEARGVDLLQPEYLAGYVPLDTTTQLLRMADRGTDYVYILPLCSTATIVMQDAERLGLLDQMVFGGLENSQGEVLMEALGAAAEGYTAPRNSPYWSEDVPGANLMRELRSRYGRAQVWQSDENNGVVAAMIVAEALRRAIEQVGIENVDGAAINAALLTISDFDCDGLRTITYTAEDHRGSDAVRIYQIRNGEVVPVTDWMAAPMITPES